MLFKKKISLRNQYDKELFDLMKQTKQNWEYVKKIEQSVFEKDGLLFAQSKLAKIKYFYLFKEDLTCLVPVNKLAKTHKPTY
ncbi:MAG: YaaL family protein [Carnobacterium sp.]